MATRKDKAKGIAAGADGVGQRDSSGLQGAEPSNTAPHNCNWVDDFVFLRSGIDTLQLSYSGELHEESVIRLRELKEIAQAEEKGERAYAQWALGRELFSINPHGSGGFPYTLVCPSYRLCLSNGRGAMPLAFVQVKSEVLTKSGAEAAVQAVSDILSTISTISDGPRISRIDVCADFSTSFDMESINRRHWITRANRVWQFAEGGFFTGWSIGLKGPISARLYDKTAEVAVSDKSYMHDVWRRCGWDGETPVWRLEFEVKRDVLRQFGVESLDLKPLSSSLWAHLTRSWLRLALPSDTDTTRARWETHPLWLKLANLDFGLKDIPSLQRVRTSAPPSYDWMFRAGAAGIFAFMAMEGIDDFSEGCAKYCQACANYHDRFAELRDSSTESFFLSKVQLLRRKHHLAVNKRPDYQYDPVKESLARHYRKGKDGE